MEQISVLGVVAAGVTVLNISGNVDISLGANIGLSTCTMAFSIINGVPVGIAIPLGILVSILCSLFVGACSILFRAPAFIISLATIGIFQGIALAFTQGTLQTIYGEFEYIGATRIAGFLPLLFLISIVVYIIIHFILQKTKLGRRVFAIGNNKRAAYLSGIKIKTNIMVFFLISGLCCGVASMMLLSRVGAVLPSTGSGTELKALGAAVIGGTPMDGGKGKIIGTFFGVLLMGVISNVLNQLQVNAYLQDVVFGALLLMALGISRLRYRNVAAI